MCGSLPNCLAGRPNTAHLLFLWTFEGLCGACRHKNYNRPGLPKRGLKGREWDVFRKTSEKGNGVGEKILPFGNKPIRRLEYTIVNALEKSVPHRFFSWRQHRGFKRDTRHF